MLAGRLPLSLDPLIAEAKRRMRRRRVVLLAVAVVLVSAAVVSLTGVGLNRSASGHVGPYTPGGMFRGTGGGPLVARLSGGTVTAVSAASQSDAWAVGSIAFHWNGIAWRTVPLAPLRQTSLWAVTDDRPGDAWAVGAQTDGNLLRSTALVEHWDGVRWRVARLPRLGAAFLYAVSATSPRNAWAVGATYARNIAHPNRAAKTQPLVLHWDGRTWTKPSLPWARPGFALDTVVATGPTSVWAVASGQQDSGRPVVLRHWNGFRWQLAPPPFGATDPFSSFSATAWNDAWAVGSYANGGNEVTKFSRPLAAHWNGHRWTTTALPNPPGTGNSFALESVAAARPNNVIAFGESQHLELQGDNGASASAPVAYFVRWNGQSWQLTSGTTPPIYDGMPAVAAGRDGSAWMVGRCRTDDFLVRMTENGWVTTAHPRDVHWAKTPGSPPAHRPPTCTS